VIQKRAGRFVGWYLIEFVHENHLDEIRADEIHADEHCTQTQG
jgi:hypothetical protein